MWWRGPPVTLATGHSLTTLASTTTTHNLGCLLFTLPVNSPEALVTVGWAVILVVWCGWWGAEPAWCLPTTITTMAAVVVVLVLVRQGWWVGGGRRSGRRLRCGAGGGRPESEAGPAGYLGNPAIDRPPHPPPGSPPRATLPRAAHPYHHLPDPDTPAATCRTRSHAHTYIHTHAQATTTHTHTDAQATCCPVQTTQNLCSITT